MAVKFGENWQRKKIIESQQFQTKAFQEVNELIIVERSGRKLILNDGKILTDFMSCSYLGLDLDERVIEAASNNIKKCGVTFPVARTRAKVQSFVILEQLLNQIFCDSHTTIFSSLHLAHLGALPLLGSGELPSFPLRSNGAYFILDKFVHASIQINRALLSQFGNVDIIDFQNISYLENAFISAKKLSQTPIVIADSIGSMGGVAPVEVLFELAEKYDGYLYIDDAHGTSIFGTNGCGFVLSKLGERFHKRLILASSLAKAFGAIAGIIALPTEQDAKMMQHYCQTYIFGGPPALSIIDSAIASAKIHLSKELSELQVRLWEIVKYFDFKFSDSVINYGIKSPIRGIAVGDEFKTIKLAKLLQKNGFALTTALYPTVPKGKGMLRIGLSAATEKEDIDKLYTAVINLLKDVYSASDIVTVSLSENL